MNPDPLTIGTTAVIILLILDRFVDFASIIQKANGNGKKHKAEPNACAFTREDCQKIDQIATQVDRVYKRIEVTQDLQRVLSAINTTLEGNTAILQKVAEILDRTQKED